MYGDVSSGNKLRSTVTGTIDYRLLLCTSMVWERAVAHEIACTYQRIKKKLL